MRSRSGGTKIGTTFESEVQVLTKPTAADLRRQILVGGGQHSRVDANPCRAAHRLHHLLLQHAQHLRLRLQTHVADLVEKNRAAVRRLELAAPIGDGAGERATHMPEQLALDQLLGNRGAVDLDERRRSPAAQARGCYGPPAPCRCRSRR